MNIVSMFMGSAKQLTKPNVQNAGDQLHHSHMFPQPPLSLGIRWSSGRRQEVEGISTILLRLLLYGREEQVPTREGQACGIPDGQVQEEDQRADDLGAKEEYDR